MYKILSLLSFLMVFVCDAKPFSYKKSWKKKSSYSAHAQRPYSKRARYALKDGYKFKSTQKTLVISTRDEHQKGA